MQTRQLPSETLATAGSDSPGPIAAAATAKAAGLTYVDDSMPGIRRKQAESGFVYEDPQGRRLRDKVALERIRSLVIPPAWTDVWICPLANGHLQATGRDARGRKQYRYHSRWRSIRDETKFDRMIAFGQALPKLRARVESDLSLPGVPRDRVLAVIVRLLDTTLLRVGNTEYARSNQSFGLTTLRDRHVAIKGSTLTFEFKGKSGVRHCVNLEDRRLARIVKRLRDLPGQDLFQYMDESGCRRVVGSADVNAYLKQITGSEFTAKDFRTWAGTVLAASELRRLEAPTSRTQANRLIVGVVEVVAHRLGNTRTVCRKCYIHPAVFEVYMEGSFLEAFGPSPRAKKHLDVDEVATLAFLRQLASQRRRSRAG